VNLRKEFKDRKLYSTSYLRKQVHNPNAGSAIRKTAAMEVKRRETENRADLASVRRMKATQASKNRIRKSTRRTRVVGFDGLW
jgi:hypothetical protein